MLPDSGAVAAAFEKSEVNVVVDTHPPDTTDRADLVLPTLTLLEDDDVMGAFGNHWIRESRPAIAPPDGPRHELEILQGLAERVGLAEVMAGSIEDWKRRVLADLVRDGLDREALRAGPQRSPKRKHVLFEGGAFPTASGKANLLDESPLPPPEVTADYPLTLMATSTPKAQSSQWSVKPPPGPPEARVHPDSSNGVADGDTALLESRVAAMAVRVRHDDTMRRDVIWMAKGGMLRDGQCANLLVSAVESDEGGGAAYYDELVRLRAPAGSEDR
jgi:anaerobic selenocysteine-containing dehydrogenase